MSDARVMHVHGGSVLLDHLREAQLPGETLEWCDPVSSGPTPAGLSEDDWYQVRAGYLASNQPVADVAGIERSLRAQDQALRAIPPDTEVVIWVGPELFCQAILMRLLVLLPDHQRLSLVDPGDIPGSPGCGLSALNAGDLREAFAARRPVTVADRALARRAWAAFTAPGARALAALVDEIDAALPHLRPALRRHLADLPDGATGLSTTEAHLLRTLERGPLATSELLPALTQRERRPFLTDLMLEEILERLAADTAPLVNLDPQQRWRLTLRGADVLAGQEVWSAERWHGGVHITGTDDDDDDLIVA